MRMHEYGVCVLDCEMMGFCFLSFAHLKSPLLPVTLSAEQYSADVSNTTISMPMELLPRELVTRHCQLPETSASTLERITSLRNWKGEEEKEKAGFLSPQMHSIGFSFITLNCLLHEKDFNIFNITLIVPLRFS